MCNEDVKKVVFAISDNVCDGRWLQYVEMFEEADIRWRGGC